MLALVRGGTGVSGQTVDPNGNWDLESLVVGLRVEVDGRLAEDGVIEAFKVTIEKPDPYPEVKGTIASIDLEAMTVSIPPFTLQFTPETDIDDEDSIGDSYLFEELQPGWRITSDVEERPDGTLVAVEVGVQKHPPEKKIGVVEVEAFVAAVDNDPQADVRTAVLLGQKVRISESIPLVVQGGAGRRPATRSVNVEDVRGEALIPPIPIGKTFLLASGEFQYDYEVRENYNLDQTKHRDISTMQGSATLELEWRFTPEAFAFFKGTSSRTEIVFDQDRNLDPNEDTRMTEGYVYWQYILDYPIGVQVGRQRFDDAREWFYDEELDAARIFAFAGPITLEYSISGFLRDNHLRENTRNQIFLASWEYAPKSHLGFRIIDIVEGLNSGGGARTEFSPFYLGLSAVGRWKGKQHYLKYWAHYAYMDGVIGFDDASAHAVDLGAGWQFRKAPFAPYFFAGYAWGSGDSDFADGTNTEFRQSTYEDNNDKLFGVVSYRYYGELFRPELANMNIWTGGFGLQPVKWLSVDFVYHRYSQDVAFPELRRSRLRANPNGLSTDLGQEFDIVLGLDKLWGHWDLELDLGWFEPGKAFRPLRDSAGWIALQIEFNF